MKWLGSKIAAVGKQQTTKRPLIDLAIYYFDWLNLQRIAVIPVDGFQGSANIVGDGDQGLIALAACQAYVRDVSR